MADQIPILTTVARQQVVEVLRGRGFTPTVKDGSVELGVGGISFRCSVPGIQQHPGAVVVALAGEVFVPAAGAVPMQDSAAGTGETAEQAVAAGVKAWIDGILPPIQSACDIGKGEESHPSDLCQIDATNKIINNWHVSAGPFQLAGPDRELLARRLEARQPFMQIASAGVLPPMPISPNTSRISGVPAHAAFLLRR